MEMSSSLLARVKGALPSLSAGPAGTISFPGLFLKPEFAMKARRSSRVVVFVFISVVVYETKLFSPEGVLKRFFAEGKSFLAGNRFSNPISGFCILKFSEERDYFARKNLSKADFAENELFELQFLQEICKHPAHISRVPVILPVPVIYRFVSVKTIEIQRLFSQVSDICRGADIPDQVAGIIEHLENGSGFGGE
jgi:hypothetical protein